MLQLFILDEKADRFISTLSAHNLISRRKIDPYPRPINERLSDIATECVDTFGYR